MIHMKTYTTLIALLFLAAGCKKNDLIEQRTPIAISDIKEQYIAGAYEWDKTATLYTVTFDESEGRLYANYQTNKTFKRVPSYLSNDTVRVEFDTWGEHHYVYALKKEGGNIKIQYVYLSGGIGPFKELSTYINPVNNGLNFGGHTFQQTDKANSFLKFDANSKWGWAVTAGSLVLNRTYNSIKNLIWYGNTHLGFMVPAWKEHTTPVMVVQNNNGEIVVFKQHQ